MVNYGGKNKKKKFIDVQRTIARKFASMDFQNSSHH